GESATAWFKGGLGVAGAGRGTPVHNSSEKNNPGGGKVFSPNAMLTMGPANGNGADGGMDGIRTFGRCTVSYNTANDNEGSGINSIGGFTFGSPSLITPKTAMNNGKLDFPVPCPTHVPFKNPPPGFPPPPTPSPPPPPPPPPPP